MKELTGKEKKRLSFNVDFIIEEMFEEVHEIIESEVWDAVKGSDENDDLFEIGEKFLIGQIKNKFITPKKED